MDSLLREILASRVYEVARETPLDVAPRLSRRLDNHVLLKREDSQPIFSFKIRGAYNRIARLTPEEREPRRHRRQRRQPRAGRRLFRTPAGHPRRHRHAADDAGDQGGRGQGARRRGRAGRRPLRRGAAARASGSRPRPASSSSTRSTIRWSSPDRGRSRSRLLRQAPGISSAVFVPVGGGGLIAGIGAYVKAVRPDSRRVRRRAGRRRRDGAVARGRPPRARWTRSAFSPTASRCSRSASTPSRSRSATVTEVIRVSNDEICAAIKDVFDDTRTIVEPAGALAVAGLKSYVDARGVRGQRLAAVLSGANMNFDRLRFVAERAELGEGARGAARGDDSGAARRVPGVLRRAGRARRHRVQLPASGRDQAQIFVGVATAIARDEGDELAARLRERRLRDGGSLRQRDGEAARAAHGGRAHAARRRASACAASSSPSVRARCCSSSTRSAGAGTSACSTTATTAPTSDACSRRSRCRTASDGAFDAFLSGLGYHYTVEEGNEAYRRFLGPSV